MPDHHAPEAPIRTSIPVPVREIDIQRFAGVLGLRHTGGPAPAGFHFTLAEAAEKVGSDSVRLPDGRLAATGTPAARALAAGTDIEFLAPIQAGDTVTVTERLLSREQRRTRAGIGTFNRWERTYRGADGTLLVREVHTVFLHPEDPDDEPAVP